MGSKEARDLGYDEQLNSILAPEEYYRKAYNSLVLSVGWKG